MKKTILWALNSKCGFNCKYCYLNFPEDKNPINNINNKESEDLSEDEIFEFISKLKENGIERIFIAGAEPLSYPTKTFKIIEEIKKYDLQVVLCTNGYTLSKNYKEIIKCKIDAISISLDSYDKNYNDKYRQYPENNGWEKVVDGIKLLKKEKIQQKSNIKIGIYAVLTKINMKNLDVTYQFVSKLGLDYFVFQPIYLDKDNELFEELTLDKSNIKELKKMIKKIYYEETNTKLPNKQYIELLVKSIEGSIETIKNCFAGEKLFFVTPDGGIHSCPSSNCIVDEKQKLTIKDNLKEIFKEGKYKIASCEKFSEDCVNMWQLMAFDEILK